MNNTVKAAIIFALGMIAAASIYSYFSPYHSCARDLADGEYAPEGIARICSGNSN